MSRSFWIVAVICIVFATILLKKESHFEKTSIDKDPAPPSIATIEKTFHSRAKSPINSKRMREASDRPLGEAEEIQAASDICENPETTDLIASRDFDEFKELLSSDEKVKICAVAYGLDKTCLDHLDPSSPGAKICEANTLLTRARIIHRILGQKDLRSMNESEISNRLIASVHEAGHDASQVFKLANRLLELDYINPEAHNIRGVYGIQEFVKSRDVSDLKLAEESAVFLENSGRDGDYRKSQLLQYLTKLAKYTKDSNPEDLAILKRISEKFVERYPKDSTGYYLQMQTFGYLGDKEKSLEWLDQGLAIGQREKNYSDYLKVKKLILRDGLKPEHLGLRIDPEKFFNPKDLLGLND